MKRKFKVLYTHQKAKKRKVWQDGTLTLTGDEKRGYLCDEDNKQLSTVYLNKKQVEDGVDLECDKYLIQVEEEVSHQSEESTQSSQPAFSQNVGKPSDSQTSSGICSQPVQGKVRSKFSVPRKTEVKKELPSEIDKDQNHLQKVNHSINDQSIWCNVTNNENDETDKTNISGTSNVCRNSQPFVRDTNDLLKLLGGDTTETIGKPSLVFQSVKCKKENVTSTTLADINAELPSFLQDSNMTVPSGVSVQPPDAHLRQQWRRPRAVQVENDFSISNGLICNNVTLEVRQNRMRTELFFPKKEDSCLPEPCYSVFVPSIFTSVEEYIKTWTSVLNENLNMTLWHKSRAYHSLMENADVSNFMRQRDGTIDDVAPQEFVMPEISTPEDNDIEIFSSTPPYCEHDVLCKVARVRKQGQNTGRVFYTCAKGRKGRCKFFKWADTVKSAKTLQAIAPSSGKVKINNGRAFTSYLNRSGINFYIDCKLNRKSVVKEEDIGEETSLSDAKRKWILKLTRQDRSLSDSKDGLWVISRSFDFSEGQTLIVKVLSHGVSTSNELVVQPLGGFVSNEWLTGDDVQAMFICKASIEFNCLFTLQKNVRSMPLLPHLLNGNNKPQYPAGLSLSAVFNLTKSKTLKATNQISSVQIAMEFDDMLTRANQYSSEYKLNEEQSAALAATADLIKDNGRSNPPILLIDGVVGSGKTFLLSVILILLYDIMNQSTNQLTADDDSKQNKKRVRKWKIMVCSTSNAAVDNVLKSLLRLGFDRFARIGNIDEVNRCILPYTVHSKGGSNEQIKQLKDILRQTDQSDPDRHYIKKSLDQVQCGATKRLLHNAFIVGTTCEGSLSPSIGYYKFPIVVMDDAVNASETSALLPLARFGCEKLLLAGDLKLHSSSANQSASKQSLFQRLQDGGHDAILLTTQYRYHPIMTSLLNNAFYDGTIVDGISEEDRPRLVKGLPNVCFYDVPGKVEMQNPNDYSNSEEAKFIADVIKLLLSHGVPGTSVVVMTTYNAQVKEIKDELREIEFYDMSDVNCIRITMFDEYDGEERNVVITSLVGSCVDDRQTIVPLLTRARNHVIVAANLSKLSTNHDWKKLIDLSKQHKDRVQSLFQFKKFFQKSMNSGENKFFDDEIPFLAENLESNDDPLLRNNDDVTSSQSDCECETADNLCDDTAEALLRHNTSNERSIQKNDTPDCSDDIPLLRHNRKRKYFTLEDSDTSDDVT